MTKQPAELIEGYFDDMLTAEEQALLSDWIKSDPRHASEFAQASLLHDRLRSHFSVGDTARPADAKIGSRASLGLRRAWWSPVAIWSTTASVSFVLIGLGLLWFSFGQSTASAAYRELDRLIVNSVRMQDRTYLLVVEDMGQPPPGRRAKMPEAHRPPKPPLDGAVLHLRDNQHFVLIRKTAEGADFVTGSNGKESWAVKNKGPVRVSRDVQHFSRDLPGHETSIPLTNLHEGLERLRHAYHLHFSEVGPEEYAMNAGEEVRMLVAVKKPNERGSQRVEIAYETTTGRILHMRFIQMPYGPDWLDLRLSLLNEDVLPSEFFEHTSHHAMDRQVEWEN